MIRPFILTPEKGARTSVYLATAPEVADVTGQYFVKCRVRTPSPAAQDEAAAVLLWSVSEELVDRAAGPRLEHRRLPHGPRPRPGPVLRCSPDGACPDQGRSNGHGGGHG